MAQGMKHSIHKGTESKETQLLLMLVHESLTMAAIYYESIMSTNLCDKLINLLDDIQKLPTNIR